MNIQTALSGPELPSQLNHKKNYYLVAKLGRRGAEMSANAKGKIAPPRFLARPIMKAPRFELERVRAPD